MTEEILKKYSQDRTNLLPLLYEMQAKEKYVSAQAIKEISHYLCISENDVYSVASFFADFTFNRSVVKLIEICNCITCRLQGANQIMEIARHELASKAAVMVKATYFTSSSTCAPVVRIDGVFHYNVTISNLRKLLQSI